MSSMATKIVFYIDDDSMPYLMRLGQSEITLKDFKKLLKSQKKFKYFFQVFDDQLGLVKEEFTENNAKLPHFNGQVTSWLRSAEDYSTTSETGSDSTTSSSSSDSSFNSVSSSTEQSSQRTLNVESNIVVSRLDLTADTDLRTICHVMMDPKSGLDVRDRVWLKTTIPKAFTGFELVRWLYANLEGFIDRRDAKKFAVALL